MAENYTAVPTPYDGSTPMVEDGDPLDAASVRAGMEKHANAIRSVQGVVTPAAAGITTAITRTVLAMPGFLEDAEYDSANMRVQETADAADATLRSNVIWDLPLPHGATLNSVTIYVDGAGTTLPAVLGSCTSSTWTRPRVWATKWESSSIPARRARRSAFDMPSRSRACRSSSTGRSDTCASSIEATTTTAGAR